MFHECIRLSLILELSLTERRMLLKTKEQENGGWFTPNKIVTSEESFTLIHITDVYLLCCLFNCLQTTADDHNYSECEVWRQLRLPTAGCRWGFAGPGSSWVQVQWSEYFSLFKVTHYTSTLLLLLPLTFVFRGRPEQCRRFVLLLLLLLSAVELQTNLRKDYAEKPLLEPSPGWKRLLSLSHLRHY